MQIDLRASQCRLAASTLVALAIVFGVPAPLLAQHGAPQVEPSTQPATAAEYKTMVQRQISRTRKKNLSSYTPEGGANVAVTFFLARDGRLLDVIIARSSGVAEIDAAALDHISRAAPFVPFAPDMTGESRPFTMQFVYR